MLWWLGDGFATSSHIPSKLLKKGEIVGTEQNGSITEKRRIIDEWFWAVSQSAAVRCLSGRRLLSRRYGLAIISYGVAVR